MQNNDTNGPLQQSVDEKLFRLLVANVKDYAIFMIDQDGYILTWNQGAAQIKGYKENEILGKHISVFYTEEDRKADEPLYNLNEALTHGTHESEGWRIRKNGSRFYANIVFTTLYDENNNHIGFAKITRDITEQRVIEEQKAALQDELEKKVKAQTGKIIANELRFRKLIEHSYDGISLLDESLKIFYRSLSAEKINGLSNKERGEYELADLVHPDDRQQVDKLLAEILQKPAKAFVSTFRVRHKNGHYIWVECVFTNMLDDEYIKAVICNFKDVTERMRNEEELNRQNAVLREISWISSHDVRRPVASIMGLVHLMNMSKTIKEKKEILDMVNKCANELDEMIHQINDKISRELGT